MSLDSNIAKVKENIRQACERVGRNVDEVRIIAVTKYVDIEETKKILDLGLVHIGENRDKQAVLKYETLGNRGTWHFIGSLQSRKVKDIIGKYEYIHSLDRLSLAQEIDKRAKQLGIQEVKCFIQVNVSGELTKSGLDLDQLFSFVNEINQYKTIRIMGLMTMAPHVENQEQTRPIFRKLKELMYEINDRNILDYPLTELSMGMSNDYEIAVEEGATFVRLGTVLWSENNI